MLVSVADFFESRDNLALVHKGIVADNRDPEKAGRIKVFVAGLLVGDPESLPWCYPLLPPAGGGSPNTMDFRVPEVGAEVEVAFRGRNVYYPVYTGTTPAQSMGLKELFGKHYPHTLGGAFADGTWYRMDQKAREAEAYLASGAVFRSTFDGSVEVNVPGDFVVKADRAFSVIENFWESGGGGLGALIEEVGYAVLDGPHLQGILDLANALPSVPGDKPGDPPRPMRISEFAALLKRLSAFAATLSTLDPDFVGLGDLIRSFGADDRSKITKAFVALGGTKGFGDMLRQSFGLIGGVSTTWLDGNESLLDSVVRNLASETALRAVFKGADGRLTEEQTGAVVQKVQQGFSALAGVAPKLEDFDGLQSFLADWKNEWDPNAILKALPVKVQKPIYKFIVDTVKGLLSATSGLDPRSQIVYLGRLQFSRYFRREWASVEEIARLTRGLLGAGVDPYHLGLSGHVVRDALSRGPEKFDVVGVAAAYLGAGGTPDKAMRFLDDLEIDTPLPTRTANSLLPPVAGAEEARDPEKVVPDDLGVSPDRPAYVSHGRVLAILDELRKAGGTGGVSGFVAVGGKAVGSLARTGVDPKTCAQFLKTVAGWFGAYPREGSAFVRALDIPVLQNHGIAFDTVADFLTKLRDTGVEGIEISPYGGNINQLLDSGFADEFEDYLLNRLKAIKDNAAKTVTHEVLRPKSFAFAAVFGSPQVSSALGQNSLYRKTREMEVASARLGRLGKNFRRFNADLVNAEIEAQKRDDE